MTWYVDLKEEDFKWLLGTVLEKATTDNNYNLYQLGKSINSAYHKNGTFELPEVLKYNLNAEDVDLLLMELTSGHFAFLGTEEKQEHARKLIDTFRRFRASLG